MLALKLVRLIEHHSDELASNLVKKLQTSEHTTGYRKLPASELKAAVSDVYCNLGEWLLSKTESDVELRYRELGIRRANNGIPFSQFVSSMLMTKEQLWSFLRREAMSDGALELYGELEFLQTLMNFYDKAIYYSSVGYEQQRQQAGKAASAA
jgi:hypothetical protein